MIKSFKDRETETILNGEVSRRYPLDIQKTAKRKLEYLHAANSLQDLAVIPGHRLEKLAGDRKGQYSIRINDQWRICFKWEDGPSDVEIVDYH